MTVERKLKYIRENTPIEARLLQIAEEASEVAQAALKLIRAIGCGTPTPVSAGVAEEDLFAEIGDLKACIDVYGVNAEDYEIMQEDYARKIDRWFMRLREERHDDG